MPKTELITCNLRAFLFSNKNGEILHRNSAPGTTNLCCSDSRQQQQQSFHGFPKSSRSFQTKILEQHRQTKLSFCEGYKYHEQSQALGCPLQISTRVFTLVCSDLLCSGSSPRWVFRHLLHLLGFSLGMNSRPKSKHSIPAAHMTPVHSQLHMISTRVTLHHRRNSEEIQ